MAGVRGMEHRPMRVVTFGERASNSRGCREGAVVFLIVGGDRDGVLRSFGQRTLRNHNDGAIISQNAATKLLRICVGIRIARRIESTCIECDSAAICSYTLK